MTEARPSLGRAAAGGAFWLGLTQSVRLLLTFVATIVIARLLTPSDYGVIAMTAPLFGLIAMFQDLGLGAATIQARTLTHQQSNALFWANTIATLALALLVLGISPLVGWFYADPRAGEVAAAGSVAVVTSGLALQHSALLAREMRFRSIARVEISGLITTYGVTLVLAFAIRNYWALFLGTLAGSLVQTVSSWSASGFRPGRPRLGDIGELARFGGHVTGFNFLNFLVRNLDTVLVARFSGAAQAGIYDRSYRLLLLPLNALAGPLTRLLQPILRELRDDPVRYRHVFNLAQRALVLLMVPGVAVTAGLAEPFMLLLLGPQWSGAGRVYFWLALVGIMQPVSNPLGLLYVTTDRAGDFFRWGAISASVNVLAFAAAAPYGARAMAFALFASSLLLMPVRFGYAVRGTPVRAADLYNVQFTVGIASGAVAFAAHLLIGMLPFPVLLVGALCIAYPLAILATSITTASREVNVGLARYVRRHAGELIQSTVGRARA